MKNSRFLKTLLLAVLAGTTSAAGKLASRFASVNHREAPNRTIAR